MVAEAAETGSAAAALPAAVGDPVVPAPLEAVPEAVHEPAVLVAPPAWEVPAAAVRVAAAAGAGE